MPWGSSTIGVKTADEDGRKLHDRVKGIFNVLDVTHSRALAWQGEKRTGDSPCVLLL